MRKSTLLIHFIVICGLLLGNVSAFQNQKTIVVKVGDSNIIVDGVKKSFIVKPFIKDGKMVVQMDLIKEFPGTEIKWDGKTKSATITVEKPKIFFDGEEYDTLIQLINSATRKIDLQMYRLQEPGIINALKDAGRRGVQVRIFLDKDDKNVTYIDTDSKKKCQEDTLEYGEPSCIVRWKYGMGIMHRKLSIFDEKTVFIGSTNWTNNGLCTENSKNCNWEIGIVYNNADLVKNIENIFENEWNNKFDETYLPCIKDE